MDNIVIVEKFSSYKSGGSATVKVFTKEMFVKGQVRSQYGNKILKDRHDMQICQIGKHSISMCEISLNLFETVFSKEDIGDMMLNGILDYYGNETRVSNKYPMFSAPVYKKYGLDKSIY